MRILVVSQYFWPEIFFINDVVTALRDEGHTVVVVTGKPNYPGGKIFDGYKARGTQKEIFDGNIEVFRVPLRPRGKSGALNLLRNYFSFVRNGLKWFPKLIKDYSFDSILVFAGSPNVFIPAIPLKKKKKAHLALWVQDLWPNSLEATGFIHNKFILWLVGLLVRWTHSRADTVLVQSMAFKAPVSRYTKKEKIVYYPNSLRIPETPAINAVQLPADLLAILKSNFSVVFAGNIGTVQSVETLVSAANLLREFPLVKIILVGNGSMLEWVKQKKEELNLDNLVLAGYFLPAYMPEFFRHAGCLLVSLKNNEIFAYTIPSKVQTYLAAGKPVIAAVNGEVARIIEESGAGLTCPAEDAVGLANCIKSMYAMPEADRNKMGDAGKRYFLQNFEIREQAARLVEILNARIAGKSGVIIDKELAGRKMARV